MNHGKLVCDCPDSSPRCEQHGPDADFIAAARTGYPAMLEAIVAQIKAISRRRELTQIRVVREFCGDLLTEILTEIEALQ